MTSTRVDEMSRPWVIYERTLRRIAVVVVFGVVIYAMLGGAGMRTKTTRVEDDAMSLAVTYASVSRPGIATPFDIEIEAVDGPLPERLVVWVTSDYMSLFDENGLSPDPVETNADGEFEMWTFEPGAAQTTLHIGFDARLQPDRHRGENGTVRVEVDGRAPLTVSFHTRVSP